MLSIFRSKKDKKEVSKKDRKNNKHSSRKNEAAKATGGRQDSRTNAERSSGGIVRTAPPVAVKKRQKNDRNIRTSDVAKIWDKKKR